MNDMAKIQSVHINYDVLFYITHLCRMKPMNRSILDISGYIPYNKSGVRPSEV